MVTKTIVFSPFTRLEGDLQVTVDIEDGHVVRSEASGTLYRGFELMMRGRDPMDAMVITCRVCGQCGLAYSAASAAAIRALTDGRMPPNAYHASNVMLAIETVLSHLVHFYLSFAPDLSEPPFSDEAGRRFLPPSGSSSSRSVRAREDILGVLGLFAGKWPNTLAIQPGGTTRPVDASEIRRALGLLDASEGFVREQVIGCEPDRWLGLRSASDLDKWLGEGDHAVSDVGFFIRLGLERGLDKIGTWPARFISSGGWPGPTGQTLMRPGVCNGEVAEFSAAEITEHVKYSWYDLQEGGVHPFDDEAEPDPQREGAYSWAKAPRYAGETAEAGPLARLVNDRDPLITDLLSKHGPSVLVREIARLHETVRLVRQIGVWLRQIGPEQPFYEQTPQVESGMGAGLVEAARGILGHWIRAEDGRVRNYQIISPTGWNLSPRDSQGRPGPLEEALIGTPVPDPDRPTALSHVVKSFDPCLYCTVH